MSVLTEVLKLFKYDPATDGDMTFNIGQCMNDNWDKLDAAILLAIAAAGAYNPEESYAVGDYCTYQGKLRKCSTAIPTGEAWTEAHWTTTTVAAELAELSSQLSNTALSSHGVLQDVNILDWAVTRKRSGAFTSQPGCTGVPNSSLWYAGNLFVNIAESAWSIILIETSSMVAWYNATESGVWKGWKPIATATPPQEFDLPLAEGVSGLAKYSKDQFGRVQLRGWITGATANSVVATLPSGFRPASGAHFIQAITSSTQNSIARVVVRTDGTVYVELPQDGTLASGLSLQLSFAAAS